MRQTVGRDLDPVKGDRDRSEEESIKERGTPVSNTTVNNKKKYSDLLNTPPTGRLMIYDGDLIFS